MRLRVTLVALLVLLLIACATVPRETYTDSNPRFEVLGMEQPFGSLILITLRDRETGKEYVIVAIKDNGMSVVEVR